MFKNHRKTMIIGSVITLLPILAGLILWNRLPETLPTHWGADGAVDGWGGRAFVVCFLPLLMLGIFWLMGALALLDRRNRGNNERPMARTMLVIPLVSLVASGSIYAYALGASFSPFMLLPVLMSAMFLILGNYMPKCKLNYTFGIKTKWALANEENWNRTHRFGGRVWVFGGILMLVCALLPVGVGMIAMTVLILLMIALPFAYSYLMYRRQRREGTWEINGIVLNQRATVISGVCIAAILVFVAVLMLTGDIRTEFGDDALTVQATYYEDVTIPYAQIDSAEFRETDVDGTRVYGFGSARLKMGQFHTDEFGSHTRYTYTFCDAGIVLRIDGKTFILSGKDAEETRSIYETLQAHITE